MHACFNAVQYRKYHLSEEEEAANRPRALLKFAGNAILSEIHDKHRRWTWEFFAQRRDDRKKYVELFKKKTISTLTPTVRVSGRTLHYAELPKETQDLQMLETSLSYEDIRFYRSIARSDVRKDAAARRKLEEQRKKEQPQQASGGWIGWVWGSNTTQNTQQTALGQMTDEQRKELYDAIDFDEKEAVAASLEVPREAQKMRIAAHLDEGSFALRRDPHGKDEEVVSVRFAALAAGFVQRPDNFEASLSLGSFSVFDGTAKDTPYHQIVRVKDPASRRQSVANLAASTSNTELVSGDATSDQFLFVKFENDPLDKRADSAVTIRMRYMEIIYHKEVVESIYQFFRPPESQLESVEALVVCVLYCLIEWLSHLFTPCRAQRLRPWKDCAKRHVPDWNMRFRHIKHWMSSWT